MTSFYNGYFDDSGTHDDSPVVVAAGLIFRTDAVQDFSREWDEAIKSWKISTFHMTDFESRHGLFKHWTDEERRDRLNRLLGLIEIYAEQSIGFVIPKRSFDELFSKEAKSLCGDAFGFAALACFEKAAQIAADPRLDAWVDYTIERGSKGYQALELIWREGSKIPAWSQVTRITSLSTHPKAKFPPLQAADIVAYELYKQGLRQFGAESRGVRYPLRRLALMHKGNKSWNYPADGELEKNNAYLSSYSNPTLT